MRDTDCWVTYTGAVCKHMTEGLDAFGNVFLDSASECGAQQFFSGEDVEYRRNM